MKKIKILYVINNLQIGGAEKNLTLLVNYIKNKKTNFEFYIICLDTISDYYKEILSGVKVYELEIKKKNIFYFLISFYQIIKKINPDIIHSWLYASDFIASLFSLIFNKKIIWSIRSTNTSKHLSLTGKIILKFLGVLSKFLPTKIIANSYAGKKDHIKIGYDKNKIEVINNGFNFDFYKKKINRYIIRKFKKKINLKKNEYLIGTIGRDHAMKDHETFIKSAFYLQKKIINFKYLILGEGVSHSIKLKSLIKKLKLEKKIILMEPTSLDINIVYRSLDLFCLTSSDSEGFPNVLVESIANKVITLSTNVGDAKKIINNQKLFLTKKNPNLISNKIYEILNLNYFQKSKIIKGLLTNIYKFNFDKIYLQFLDIYSKTIFNNNLNDYNKIGLVPLSDNLNSPGDRRRFAAVLKNKNLPYKIISEDKKINSHKIVFLTQKADISRWVDEKYSFIIYDLTDSYLAIPKTNIKGWLRGFAKYIFGQHKKFYLSYWKLLEKMCRRADLIICSTLEQKKIIQKYNKNVFIILDLKDNSVKKYKKTNYKISQNKINIVWEGLPQNVYLLKNISKVLDNLSFKYKIVLNIITDKTYKSFLNLFYNVNTFEQLKKIFKKTKFKLYQWNLNNYFKIIINSDLAVIPTDLKDKFIAGKPENKLLLFWRLRLPVITSASSAYKRTMKSAKLNNYCYNDKEWHNNIENLILNFKNRKDVAKKGFFYTKKQENKKIFNEWEKILKITNKKIHF